MSLVPTETTDCSEKTSTINPILSWSDISYDVKTKNGVRRLLHSVSGSIYPGELVAIMGSSGAGKTTLLNVLAGRIQGGKLYGNIKFNGSKRNPHDFKRILAYVEQDDLMHATLSVKETLTVSAKLRLPSKKYTEDEKNQRVEDVMRQMRLSHVADTRIGDSGMRGVSGGERKRVSIGIELVTDPSILVLDEPSSGLDSSSAEMVVKLTKEMSRERNLTTLMTIHQPSAEMVAQFDKLILLSQGKLVYMGPADKALRYFEQLGHPSTNPNPANFYIDLMTIDFSSTSATSESEARVQSLVDSFAKFRRSGSQFLTHDPSFSDVGIDNCATKARNSCEIGEIKDGGLPSSSAKNEGFSGPHANIVEDITQETANLVLYEAPPKNSWISELFVLLKRDWILSIRNTSLVYGFLFQSVVVTIFLGFVFFQMKTDQASIQNRTGVIFMLIIQSSFPVTFPTLVNLMVGKSVLMRERSTGTYRMSSYFISKFLSLLPLVILPLFVILTGTYFIAHFQYNAAKYFVSLVIILANIYSSLAFAFAIAFLIKSIDTAMIVMPVVMGVLFLFCGNMSNSNTVTPVLRWIKYICLYFYAYTGFMQNEFGGLTFTCDNNSSSCYHTGEEVLSAYALNELSLWLTIVINFALGTAMFVAAYIGLRWVVKSRYLCL
ncbi:hypothetical protein GGI23_002501 [Coemansia sp. RSA 2559]|nr:hypothetical protein GGI23_002501 [Coemansia sp. RSA 2559]